MAAGIWRTQTVGGITHNILFQEEEADCGLCCCGMIVNLRDGSKPTSDILQRNLPQGAYKKSTRDRTGFKQTIFHKVAPSAHNEYHSAGTYIQSLSHVLSQYGINNTAHNGASPREALRTASTERPMIILVNWLGGGGHWIVVAGASHNRRGLFGGFRGFTRMTILDPYYGLTTSDGTNATYTSAVRDGDYGSGSFAPYWLQVG